MMRCREALSAVQQFRPQLSETRHVRHSRFPGRLCACAWRDFDRRLGYLTELQPLSARKRCILIAPSLK
jgi:hypothetical protein